MTKTVERYFITSVDVVANQAVPLQSVLIHDGHVKQSELL